MLGRQLPGDSLEVRASASLVLKSKEAKLRNNPTSRLSESRQRGKLHLRKRKKWIEFYIKYNIFYCGPFKGSNTWGKKKTFNSSYQVTSEDQTGKLSHDVVAPLGRAHRLTGFYLIVGQIKTCNPNTCGLGAQSSL